MIQFFQSVFSCVFGIVNLIWNFPIVNNLTFGVVIVIICFIALMLSVLWGRKGD